MNILAIIPARGGSKGIPRKNLRALAGRPLIAYSIATVLASRYHLDVFVSTDDEEIATIARKLGAGVIVRDTEFARDQTTLDPVIYDALQQARHMTGKDYEFVATVQPTSPLLRTHSLDAAIDRLLDDSELETVISAKENTHLTWRKSGERYMPNYEKRINRQYLPAVFQETGGFLITRANLVTQHSRIGSNVDLVVLSQGEAIDIDSQDDWSLCEYYLKRKFVLFVVAGNSKIGLGHVYNTLLMASDLVRHRIEFLVDSSSELARQKIAINNYTVHMQDGAELIENIRSLRPDVVVNDRLDTSAEYVKQLKAEGIAVINFEDLGPGAKYADLVINAIYPEQDVLPGHYFGPKFFLLRDEFVLTHPRPVSYQVRRVLLSFGGVDPNNLTCKVISSIYHECRREGIKIVVAAGFGYVAFNTLERFEGIEVYQDSQSIADLIRDADLVFTSAGRTTYEIASQHKPAIVLAQNAREMTHFFASPQFGFYNLGLGSDCSEEQIRMVFCNIIGDYEFRCEMSKLMAEIDLSQGRVRTLRLIQEILEK